MAKSNKNPPALAGKEVKPSTAPAKSADIFKHPLLGSLKGTIAVLPGVDLTEPADPDWGKVYE
ncbi:MAG: hypothetical protein IT535_00395 [Bauldia sp.]|nr:hypothetical protein [Bauldia sp.]